VVVAGAIWYLFERLTVRQACFSTFILTIAVTCGAVGVVAGLWFLGRVLAGRAKYGSLPYPKEISDFVVGIEEHYNEEAETEDHETSDGDIRKAVLDWYVEAAEKSAKTNDAKSECLHKAHIALLIAAFSVVVGAGTIAIVDYLCPPPSGEVQPVQRTGGASDGQERQETTNAKDTDISIRPEESSETAAPEDSGALRRGDHAQVEDKEVMRDDLK